MITKKLMRSLLNGAFGGPAVSPVVRVGRNTWQMVTSCTVWVWLLSLRGGRFYRRANSNGPYSHQRYP